MLRDPEFGPVRLRAFGSYEMRVDDPGVFLKEVVGTDGRFRTSEIVDRLRGLIVPQFTDKLGESRIPVLDLAANYEELGELIRERMHDEFSESYGLEVTKLVVENISLPPAVEEALDKRTSMGVIGDLDRYTKFQAAEAMEAAATNPAGGGASEGMGLGMGFGMAQAMAGAMAPQTPPAAPAPAAPAAPATPPPLPASVSYFAALDGQQAGPFDLEQLRSYVQAGRISRSTLVWCAGMANWTAAGEVADLASLFASVRPRCPLSSQWSRANPTSRRGVRTRRRGGFRVTRAAPRSCSDRAPPCSPATTAVPRTRSRSRPTRSTNSTSEPTWPLSPSSASRRSSRPSPARPVAPRPR